MEEFDGRSQRDMEIQNVLHCRHVHVVATSSKQNLPQVKKCCARFFNQISLQLTEKSIQSIYYKNMNNLNYNKPKSKLKLYKKNIYIYTAIFYMPYFRLDQITLDQVTLQVKCYAIASKI